MKLYPYSNTFIPMFKNERENILDALPHVEVHHIGSTAIPRIGGKGIIDILVAIQYWKERNDVVEILKNLGFHHVHPEENGRIFLSRIGPTIYGDTHIHLVERGGKEYEETLLFRNYLREHEEAACEYDKLKHQWLQEAGGDREKYRMLKVSYVQHIIERAKNLRM